MLYLVMKSCDVTEAPSFPSLAMAISKVFCFSEKRENSSLYEKSCWVIMAS